ncbi:MAG: hypothetical protein KJ044_01505 [Planctomycetes bacterium]|nr:hypothetical protein [Planctomycetota bacterium]
MRQILARIACVGGLAALLVALAAPSGLEAQQDFKEAKKTYENGKKDESRTAMERAVDDMAASNDTEAAKYLLKELADDQKARKSGKKGLPGEVRKRIIAGLARFTDENSVKMIGESALKLNSAPKGGDPTLALDQFDFFYALAAMKDSKAADATITSAIADTKNPYIKVAAIEAVRQAGAKRFAEQVIAVLLEENKEWATTWTIVPINVFACLEKIVEPGDTQLVIQTLEATITWEERKLCSDERVRFFGGRMLRALTGEVIDMASTFFWKWWVAQMKISGKVDTTQKPDAKRSKTAATPPVFDTQPVGKRFVFVVDFSDSMNMPLKITLEEIEKRRRSREGPTTPGKGEKAQGGAEDEEGGNDNNPLRRLPWKDIRTKLDLAREELSRAIKEFAGDRQFAIIAFGTKHELVTGGWVQASQANCDKWSRDVKKIELMGMTNIHGSILRALRLNKNGDNTKEPAVDPECILSGADCIVFMTDGWGSWDDQSVSRVKDKRNNVDNSIGDGQFIYGEDIWSDLLRYNIFRKVVIHCVGIGNHDKELLRKLASETGGQYVDWFFPEG